MIKKIARGILYGITTIFVVAVVIYFIDRDYYEGNQIHYKGESVITADQAALIASRHMVGGQDIPLYEIQEDGLVNAQYDFYGEPDLDFLESGQYSVFDGPMVYMIGDIWWKTVIVFGLIFLAVYLFMSNGRVSLVFYTGIWYMCHPWVIFRNPSKKQFRYVPNITGQITVDKSKSGIYAIRTWKYNRTDELLYSAVAKNAWRDKITVADKLPEDGNENGIYAYRLGMIKIDYPQVNDYCGIVNLDGDCTEHEDGVIRAERCEILCLIINSRYKRVMAENLSAIYGVPVVMAEKPLACYQQWLWGKDGIECLSHNAEILTGGVNHGNESQGYQEGKSAIPETCRSTDS